MLHRPDVTNKDLYKIEGRHLDPLTLSQGLCQLVNFPTHLRSDGSLGSTQDLLLSSEKNILSSVQALLPLGRSENVALYCDLSAITANNRINNTRPGRRILKYESCDIEKLNEDLL